MLLDWLSVTAGVLSLSEVRDDLLMWASYADGHKGFLVGFDSEHEAFQGDRTPQMGSLAPAQYRLERPTISFDELDVPVAYFVKGDAWKHQREWRLCRPPEYAAEIIQTDGAPIFLFDIPAGAIAEVVVGCRACQKLTHDVAIALNTPLYAHVAVLQAAIDPRHYRLNIEPVEAQDLARWRAWSPPRASEPTGEW